MAKLLLVIDCLGSGGAQRQLVSLARGFVAQGHEVEFFIYFPELNHFENQLTEIGIVIHSSSKASRFSLKPVFKLSSIIVRNRYHSILAFMRNPAIYTELSYLVARVCGAGKLNLVFSERLNYFEREKKSLIFRLCQQLHRLCDHIVVNNHYQCDEMAVFFPWMKNRLVTIYNGLEPAIFKQRTSVLASERYLLVVARVVEYKNYENLALALIHYKNTWGQAPKIQWVGKIFQTGSNLKKLEYVNHLLQQHGLENNLRFCGEHKNLIPFYQNARALIHPSLIEGFSNVVIEACEFGLPLLIGNIGDHQLLMNRYDAGLIFDVNDPIDIATKIRCFELSEQIQQEYWGEQAKLARQELFCLDKACHDYLSLLVNNDAEY